MSREGESLPEALRRIRPQVELWDQPAVLAAAKRIAKLESALLDVYHETSDMGVCPYLLRGQPGADPHGTCGYGGCTDEPECLTCTPEEGWLTQRHPVIAEVVMETMARGLTDE